MVAPPAQVRQHRHGLLVAQAVEPDRLQALVDQLELLLDLLDLLLDLDF